MPNFLNEFGPCRNNLRQQELTTQQTKHKREIESMRSQFEYFTDEKVREAVADKGLKQRQSEDQHKLQISRLEQHNSKLLLQVEEQAKRLEKIPGELGGTAGENGLLEELKREFRADEITGKKNGVAMADIIQYIVTERGERINMSIVFDKKTSSKERGEEGKTGRFREGEKLQSDTQYRPLPYSHK